MSDSDIAVQISSSGENDLSAEKISFNSSNRVRYLLMLKSSELNMSKKLRIIVSIYECGSFNNKSEKITDPN